MNYRTAPSRRRPSDQASQLVGLWVCLLAARVYTHHCHLLLLHNLKADTNFTDHPTEGRRLSQLRWLVTHRDVLPSHRWSPISVLTAPNVDQLVDGDQQVTTTAVLIVKAMNERCRFIFCRDLCEWLAFSTSRLTDSYTWTINKECTIMVLMMMMMMVLVMMMVMMLCLW